MADPVTLALIAFGGVIAGGIIGVAGSVLTARVAADAAARHAESAWLRDAKLRVYARVDGAAADILQAVQDAAETPPRRLSDVFPRYSKALDEFTTAANEAALLCDEDLYRAMHDVARVTDAITLEFPDDARWPDPAVALDPGRAPWEPRATLEPLVEVLTDHMRVELGRSPLPPIRSS